MSKDADVIVIGGGIIGCSVTYYLSKMGKRYSFWSGRI